MKHGIVNEAPILSVVLNWNGAKTLYDTLRDLNNQTAAPHRILVIDNASSDGSVDKLSQDFPEVELLRLQENVGFAKGNNAVLKWDGWKEVDWRNGWIFLSNNDVFYKSEMLELLRQVGEEKEDSVSVSSWIAFAEPPDRLWFGGGSLHPAIGVMGHSWFKNTYSGKEDSHIITTDYATACSVLIPSKYFFDVGGFDTSFPHYVEDADLSLRLRKKFQGICYLLQKTLAFHRVSSSTGGSADKYRKITSGQIHLLRTHYTSDIFGYVGIFIYNSLMAVKRKGITGFFAVCRGWWDGIRNRPIVWEQPR